MISIELPSLLNNTSLESLTCIFPLQLIDAELSQIQKLGHKLPVSIKTLCFRFISQKKLDKVFNVNTRSTWEEIDKELNDTKFKNLKQINITTQMSISKVSDARTVFQEFLPKSYQRNLIWWRNKKDGCM